jgi:hypothetical protein
MKLFDCLELFPGAPGVVTDPNGQGVHALKLTTTGAGKRPYGRSTLDLTFVSDWCFRDNVQPMHFIVQMHATPAGWDTGYYRGHGVAVGLLFGQEPAGMIESWGPHYNPNGPGGNMIFPLSRSKALRDVTLFRLRVTTLLSKAGNKYVGYAIWQPNHPPLIDTGDCEDDNHAVDMDSDALYIGAHFERRVDGHIPAVPSRPCGVFRITNGHITHTDDCTPMPDLRSLWAKA